MKRARMKRSIAAAVPNHRLNVYEVSPTVPGPYDKDRDAEVNKAISEWKARHSGIKVR
jgi:hypothetical protein